MADDWSYVEALREVWARSNYERGFISNPFGTRETGLQGLARVRYLLDVLDRPDHDVRIAHVAGSKGKGSTSAMIAAIARAAGMSVGLFTSPHLHTFRERIAVDGSPISEPDFARVTQAVTGAAVQLEATRVELGRVTTFELLTAVALAHFAATRCGLVVLEVGLGGEFDATNVVTPAVSVITRLDLEHTAVLGSTLEEIATAKAGIIKLGVPVAVSPAPATTLAVLEAVAANLGAALLAGGRDWTWSGCWRRFTVTGPWGEYANLSSGLAGDHQMENAATAVAAIWLLRRSRIDLPEDVIRRGLREVQLGGRFERVTLPSGPAVVLDGAHTPSSIEALVDTVRTEFPDRRAIVVLGTSRDKAIAFAGRLLEPIASRIIATQSANPRAATAAAVASALSDMSLPTESQPTVAAALARATELSDPAGLIVVTGSLFVVADAREALHLGSPDPPVDLV